MLCNGRENEGIGMESGEDRTDFGETDPAPFEGRRSDGYDGASLPRGRSKIGQSPGGGRGPKIDGFGQRREEALEIYGRIGKQLSDELRSGTERDALRNYRASIAENQSILVEGNVLSAKDIHGIMSQIQETLSDPEMGNTENSESPVSIMKEFLNKKAKNGH